MLTQGSTGNCGILYIDDEEKALKYFKMGFSQKYKVFTAASGREGLETLRREHRSIGIVISDQRMPEMLGAEVLSTVRLEYPHIVRILTTAYSDLESAIQAVNKGHIYQYVVKPWELTELEMVLQRASDYFHVLTERNELMALKLTAVQRMICGDRVKWLMLATRNWAPEDAAAFRSALTSMIEALPETLNPLATHDSKFSPRNFDISALLREEYANGVRCMEQIDSLVSGAGVVQPQITGDAGAGSDAPDLSGGAGNSRWVAAASERLKTFLAMLKAHVKLDVRTSEEGASIVVHCTSSDSGFRVNAFVKSLFGLLVERETSDLGLVCFQTLLALEKLGKSLSLTLAGSDDSPGMTLVFKRENSGSADNAISCLYEKFSRWDISLL